MAISSVWSQGYVTDTLYTDNIFREQGPAWVNYVAAISGCVPRPLDKPFVYLELGCGLGHSISIFAAAYPEARFVGVDFNPAQVDYAQRRARELGLANLTFIEASFQDFAADPAGQGIARGLGGGAEGQVDFVAFHGIYSWVSAEARAAMRRIIFDRLKPGGLVYNSYNTLPGWSAEVPMQRLAKELALGGKGDSSKRAKDAFNQIGELAKLKSGHFAQASNLARTVETIVKKPGNYLAHEYLNGDWNAFYAPDVADEMAHAKLDFVGSATLTENHEDLVVTDEARKILAAQADPRLRLLLRDFMVNQKFRRDVFVRGHARLNARDTQRQKAQFPVVAAKPLHDLKPSFRVPRGTVTFDVPKFDALLGVLAEGAASETELAAAFAKAGGKTQDFGRLLAILTATGALFPAAKSFRPPALVKTAGQKGGPMPRQRTSLKSNAVLLQKALAGGTGAALASPVSGSVQHLTIGDVLAVNECLGSNLTQSSLAEKLQGTMNRRGMRISTDGKVVTSADALKTQMEKQAATFLEQTLPLLRCLAVLESA
jgi:SAM-dependent methyltransferase